MHAVRGDDQIRLLPRAARQTNDALVRLDAHDVGERDESTRRPGALAFFRQVPQLLSEVGPEDGAGARTSHLHGLHQLQRPPVEYLRVFHCSPS